MKNIMGITFKLLIKRKGFIASVTILPLILFLLMSILLSYSDQHSIAVINKTDNKVIEHSLNDIEGISIQDIEEDKVTESLIGGDIELAVYIDYDENHIPFTNIISAGETEISDAVELAIVSASDTSSDPITTVNEAENYKFNLGNTLPFMLFKFIEGGSVLAALIIMDRKRRVKDRIMLSNISSAKYIGGITLVYLIMSSIGTLLYYLTALILKFDIQMEHTIYFFIMLIFANIFSASVFVCMSSFINTEEGVNTYVTTLLEILAFFSGMLLPYKYMPDVFKVISWFSPQRWIADGIEQIQKTGTMIGAGKDIILILGLSIVLFVIGVINTKRISSKS